MAEIIVQQDTQPEIVVEHNDRSVVVQEAEQPREIVIGAPATIASDPTIAANVGGGDAEVFRDKTGFTLNLRTVSGTGGITVSENGDVIEVDGSGVSTPPGGVDRQIQFNDNLTAFGGADLYWTAAGLLAFAGQTATEPALKRNLAALEARLADDSAFANLSALDFVLSGGADSLGTHAGRHENGGADEISVTGLSGLLADAQTPVAHAATHADGGSDEVSVEALATSGAVGTVPTSDGLGGLSMALPAGEVDQVRTIYVGKHGNDSDDGLSVGRALLTIGAAITAATALTPTQSAPVVIRIQDSGVYAENLVLPAWVHLFGPSAEVASPGGGNTVNLDVGSIVVLAVVTQANSGFSAVVRLDTAGTAYVKIGRIDLTGTANGILNVALTQGANLFADVDTINVDSGFGIGDISNSIGHIHVEIGDIYLSGNGSTALARIGTNSTVGRVDHILETGTPTGTTALNAISGTLDLTVRDISADTAWTVAAAGTLNLFVNRVTGTRVETGTANITQAGVVNPHSSTHENGGLDEISVVGLSGLLGDPQTPLAHATAHNDGGADELVNFLYTPGRTGGQTAYGGTAAGDILTFQGANNTPDLGRIQVNSPIDVTYDTVSNTTPVESYGFIWSPNTTVGNFVGGCLEARAILTTSGAAMVPAVFSNRMEINVATTLSFAADTFINHLPVIRNQGNFNLLSELSFNCGPVHERTTSGTSTTGGATGLSFTPQSRTLVSGAVMTKTTQIAVSCRPTYSTVSGSTVNLGEVKGMTVGPPIQALFQPAAGVENMTAQYGLEMQANTFPTSGNKAAVYNLMTDSSDRFCILNDGGARSDWGGGQHYDTGQIRQPYDLVGRTLGASGDYQDGWAGAGFFFQQFNPGSQQLRWSNPATGRFLLDTTPTLTAEYNWACAKFSIGAQTGAVGNQVGAFVAPAVTVTVAGEYSQFLLTQAGNITPNANLNIFGWTINAPSINVGTGTVTTAAALNVGGNPSNATNRVGLRIISNPSGGGGVNAALWVTAGRSKFDGVVDINNPIALGGGATATLGTIGASGPTTAAQQEWVQIEVNGNTRWIPAWA